MTMMTEEQFIDRAAYATAHGDGASARLAKHAAGLAVNQACTKCLRRIGTDRVVRQCGKDHYVFHNACVDDGAIAKRLELAAGRSREAQATTARLRAALNR